MKGRGRRVAIVKGGRRRAAMMKRGAQASVDRVEWRKKEKGLGWSIGVAYSYLYFDNKE